MPAGGVGAALSAGITFLGGVLRATSLDGFCPPDAGAADFLVAAPFFDLVLACGVFACSASAGVVCGSACCSAGCCSVVCAGSGVGDGSGAAVGGGCCGATNTGFLCEQPAAPASTSAKRMI